MSINVIENITLDVHNTDLVYISCVEGEVNSRFVTVNFVDYDSPYNLNGKSVKLYILKSDGTEIFKDGNIDDEINGIATFPLSSQMSSVVGKFDVVFKIYSTNPSSELKVIGTILEVKKGNTDCGIESANDFSALQTAITNVDTILDSANIATINANDATLNANTAAANANIAISNANDAANKASNLPYIGADGYWYVYNTTLSDYQKSSVQASVSYKNNYDSSITYALNDEVYDEVTNTTYRSLKNDNTSSLTDTTSWGIISKGIGVTTDNNFTDAEKTKVDNAIQTSQMGVASGIATTDSNNKVIQNPASYGQANGGATLDAKGKVIQDPASYGKAGGAALISALPESPELVMLGPDGTLSTAGGLPQSDDGSSLKHYTKYPDGRLHEWGFEVAPITITSAYGSMYLYSHYTIKLLNNCVGNVSAHVNIYSYGALIGIGATLQLGTQNVLDFNVLSPISVSNLTATFMYDVWSRWKA